MNKRSIEIFRKASPHLMPQAKNCIDAIVIANELARTANLMLKPAELGTCDTQGYSHDPEALLCDIRPYCSARECEMIDMILSFKKSREIYNTYKILNEKEEKEMSTY